MDTDYEQVIKDVQAELSDENHYKKWCKNYKNYAVKISKNVAFIEKMRRSFRLPDSLEAYLLTTEAKKAQNRVRFFLRYSGQRIATVTCDKNGKRLLSTEDFDDENERDFNCPIKCKKQCDWNAIEAKKFRSYFKSKDIRRNSTHNNNEHRLENLLLKEFAQSTKKELQNIQPVQIGRCRYPMPTPLCASDPTALAARYSDRAFGSIDILTRTGEKTNTRLCIMEVKDKYDVKKEPPKIVLKQAIAYAVFLHELLRNEECGKEWWKLFGFRRKKKEKLILNVACVMPMPTNGEEPDTSFAGDSYSVGNDDMIELHYVYFTETDDKIKIVKHSLNGKSVDK